MTPQFGGLLPQRNDLAEHLRHFPLQPLPQCRIGEAAKARELELRDAQKEGFSILTGESLATVDDITGLFLTGLTGLAARCSRDLGIREVIQNEIFKLRQTISDTAERKARELEARRQADTKRQAAG